MSLSDDPWVAARSPIDPLKLHALGSLMLAWNYCELNLVVMFTLVTQVPGGNGWLIARDLGDVTLMNKIREALELNGAAEDAKGVVLHTLKVYDACRVNRNHLTHYTLRNKPEGGFDMVRRKGATPEPSAISSELGDIRRVADETWGLVAHLRAIVKFLRGQPSPSPPKVAVPELVVKPPPQTHPRPKRPRAPSRK